MSIRWRGFDLSKIEDTTLRSQLQRADVWMKQRDADITTVTSSSVSTTLVSLVPHAPTHKPNSSDPLTTAAAGTISPDDTAAVGTANSFARSDHTHAITAAVAGAIAPDDAAAEGVATSFSRSDHTHSIVAATPSNISAPFNQEGSATSFARSDHVHNHPAFATNDLHTQYLLADGTRDLTGTLTTTVGTFTSDVADGGDAFTLNSSNAFTSGTIFRARENGTTHFAVNHNGTVDVLTPSTAGTYPLNVDGDGSALSAKFDGSVGINANPVTTARLTVSFSHNESSAATRTACDVLLTNSATNTSGSGNAYGARTQVSNTSTTTGMRTGTTGGTFNARLKADTVFTSTLSRLVGGHFEVDSAGTGFTGTVPIVKGSEFLVQPINGKFTTITGVEVDAFNTASMTTGGGTTVYGIRLLDLTGVPSGAGTTPTTVDSIRIDAQDGSNKGADIGNINIVGAGFDEGHLQLNSGHMWANSGDIALKDSAPTSLTDYLLSLGSSNIDIKVKTTVTSPAADTQNALVVSQGSTGEGAHINLDDKTADPTTVSAGDIWRKGDLTYYGHSTGTREPFRYALMAA